jgi:hypothetical protein
MSCHARLCGEVHSFTWKLLLLLALQGNVFVNQYLIIKDLGRGAHGTVKLVLDTEDQTVYAMKASCG